MRSFDDTYVSKSYCKMVNVCTDQDNQDEHNILAVPKSLKMGESKGHKSCRNLCVQLSSSLPELGLFKERTLLVFRFIYTSADSL